MKKMTFFLLLIFFTAVSAQDNFDLSTLRIGPFHQKMDIKEADKIAGKKIMADNKNNSPTPVNYKGEIINMYVWESSDSENGVNRNIGNISTTSKKFRTKSGLGVGSTKDELIDAYRNFSSFSLYPGWNDDGTINKSESYFTLTDNDAHSVLSFKMKNNVVVEVTVYYNEDGC